MKLNLPISNRGRKYGYITWTKNEESEVRKFLGDMKRVQVIFEKEDLGEKNIDWNFRRISLGPSQTNRIRRDREEYNLVLSSKTTLKVTCE